MYRIPSAHATPSTGRTSATTLGSSAETDMCIVRTSFCDTITSAGELRR